MNGYGSICLSDIPRELIKKADNGKFYVNIHVNERREADKYGNTYNIDCRPKKEEVVEGVNYYIGNLKEWKQQAAPTVEDIEAAPAITEEEQGELSF